MNEAPFTFRRRSPTYGDGPLHSKGRKLGKGQPLTHCQERYGQTCSRNEFLTHIACAMEIAGELHENLSDRMDELIDPICKDRDWLQITGSFIVKGRPLPEDFDGQLDEVDFESVGSLAKTQGNGARSVRKAPSAITASMTTTTSLAMQPLGKVGVIAVPL